MHGKEGKSIRELTVLTPGGEMVRASREHDAPGDSTRIGEPAAGRTSSEVVSRVAVGTCDDVPRVTTRMRKVAKRGGARSESVRGSSEQRARGEMAPPAL